MATSFPTGLDAIQRVVATDLRNAPGKEGHVLHNNLCDAVEALQAKVGVDGSAVATSIDARLESVETAAGTLDARLDSVETAADTLNDLVYKPVARRLRGPGWRPWGKPIDLEAVTLSQNGGGSTTKSVVSTADGPGIRCQGSTASQYVNIDLTLPSASAVNGLGITFTVPDATQNSMSVYVGETIALTNSLLRSLSTLSSGANSSSRGSVPTPVTCFQGTNSFTVVGTVTSSTLFTVLRLRISPVAGQIADVTITDLVINPPSRGQIVITADDGLLSWWQYGIPALNKRQMPSSISVIDEFVGLPGYMTLAALQSAVAQGHECLAHGSVEGTGDPAETKVARANVTRDWLVANNLYTSDQQAECFIFPGGKFQNAHGDATYLDALLAAGYTKGRTTTRFLPFNREFAKASPYGPLILPIIGHVRGSSEGANTTEIANVLAAIASCGEHGLTGILMFHAVIAQQGSFVATDSTDIEIQRLEEILDAVATQRAAGKVDVVRFSEL